MTWRIGLPALLATVPGAWLLTVLAGQGGELPYSVAGYDLDTSPVKLMICGLMIAFAVVEWRGLTKRLPLTARHLPLGGVLSGFFGGLSGHQGAFRSAFLLQEGVERDGFIATNAAIASIVDVTRLVVYGLNISLLFTSVSPGVLVGATVAACAGVTVGKIFAKKVTISAINKLVAAMLLVLGLLLAMGVI